jgi:hypothetical protein
VRDGCLTASPAGNGCLSARQRQPLFTLPWPVRWKWMPDLITGGRWLPDRTAARIVYAALAGRSSSAKDA